MYILTKQVPLSQPYHSIKDYIYFSTDKVAILYFDKLLILDLNSNEQHQIATKGDILIPFKDRFLVGNYQQNCLYAVDIKYSYVHLHSKINFSQYLMKFLHRSRRILFIVKGRDNKQYVQINEQGLLQHTNLEKYILYGKKVHERNPHEKFFDEDDTIIVASGNNFFSSFSLSSKTLTNPMKYLRDSPKQIVKQEEQEKVNIYGIDKNSIIVGYVSNSTFYLSINILDPQQRIPLVQYPNVKFAFFNSINQEHKIIAFSLCIQRNQEPSLFQLVIYNYQKKQVKWEHRIRKLNFSFIYRFEFLVSSLLSPDLRTYIDVFNHKKQSKIRCYKRFSKKGLYFHLYLNSHLRQQYSDCLVRSIFKVMA